MATQDKHGCAVNVGDQVTIQGKVTTINGENITVEVSDANHTHSLECHGCCCSKAGETDTSKAAKQGFDKAINDPRLPKS